VNGGFREEYNIAWLKIGAVDVVVELGRLAIGKGIWHREVQFVRAW
jgi:hypothetical protein